MVENYLIELFKRNINDGKILSRIEVFDMCEKIMILYGVNNISITEISNDILAKFYQKNVLLLNPNRIIASCYMDASKNKNVSYSNKINYINYKIIQIILHEIQHIIQYNEKNYFLELCEKRENEYKSLNKYSKREYFSNPIERIAEINSSMIISNSLKKNSSMELKNEFDINIYKSKLFGYFNDLYGYPLNYYFNKDIPFCNINYDDIIIGNKISYELYNETLSKYKEMRR